MHTAAHAALTAATAAAATATATIAGPGRVTHCAGRTRRLCSGGIDRGGRHSERLPRTTLAATAATCYKNRRSCRGTDHARPATTTATTRIAATAWQRTGTAGITIHAARTTGRPGRVGTGKAEAGRDAAAAAAAHINFQLRAADSQIGAAGRHAATACAAHPGANRCRALSVRPATRPASSGRLNNDPAGPSGQGVGLLGARKVEGYRARRQRQADQADQAGSKQRAKKAPLRARQSGIRRGA